MRYRTDKIGFGNLLLTQDLRGFSYGVDAVILADFVSKNISGFSKIADLGTGNGIIPMILAHKNTNAEITGIELQESAASLAEYNIKANNLDNRIHIINKDVKNLPDDLNRTFNAVSCNPPYFKRGGGILNESDEKTVARHETTARLDDFFCAAERLLIAKGDFFLIHRPERLVDIFVCARKFSLEPKVIKFIKPYADKPANLVLVKMKKGGGEELIFLPDLIIRKNDGNYTEEVIDIYERTF